MIEKILPQEQVQKHNTESHHDLEINHVKLQNIHPTI